MSPSLPPRFAAHADQGLRDVQEDAFLAEPTLGLFAVADAMGAMISGRHAADLALTTLAAHVRRADAGAVEQRLLAAAQAANAAVFARTEAARLDWEQRRLRPDRARDPELARWHGCGTTLVALLFAAVDDRRAALVHTGDSRAYRLREGALTQLTVDHRLVDDARRAGLSELEISRLPAGVIVEALGMRAAPRIERAVLEVEPRDLFLLCSDGLSDALDSEEIAALLRAGVGDLDAAARALVTRAAEVGRSPQARRDKHPSPGDNVTVIVVQAPASGQRGASTTEG
jgi:protein phosphatase